MKLNKHERKCFALDGKELRGSIETGSKRGEVLVQAVSQENCQTMVPDYYCGKKESEVTTVRKLLDTEELAKQKLSLDALHGTPKTLEKIVEKGGKYLVGLKENQKELLKQVIKTSENQAVLQKLSGLEKGHGRIQTRSYEFYDLLEMEKDERWETCQMRTAIKPVRWRDELKTGKKSEETSYYVSNEIGNYEEISGAIRGHWQVETNNHLRDVTLKEDLMRSKKKVSIK
jgi:predicted transposase YbfD/YdcC